MRRLALAAAFALLGAIGAVVPAAPVLAAQTSNAKVVIIVGATEGATATYRSYADQAYAEAIKYTPRVTKVYSPNATWAKVRAAAQGANLFIYLGHGNGWPSPHIPYSTTTKDGLGLNATAGHGNANNKYYGAAYLVGSGGFRLATNAVVILNHLCYSAGNSEPGYPLPSKSVAEQRIANYGQTFFRIGAKAIFAEARGSAAYIVTGLFKTSKTMQQIFWSSSASTHTYAFTFTSTHAPGLTGISDPYAPSRYYRSVIGKLGTTAVAWR